MKYPLKWYHEMGRELKCWFFGHSWTSSSRRQTQYYGMDKEDVPYRYRVGEGRGNYMWESISWWKFKCTCCRVKTREWSYESFPVTLMKALRFGVVNGFQFVRYVFEDVEYSWWRKVVFGVPYGVAHGLLNVVIYFDRVPSFPITILSNVEDWFYTRLAGIKE